MRYAIVSDIHANLEALESVLATIQEAGVEKIVCLGDVVGYNSNPNECCDRLRELGIPTVVGNHDAVACGLEEPIGFNPVALASTIWTRENLRKDNAEWLRGLPAFHKFDSCLAVHGAPGDRDFYIRSWEDIFEFIPHVKDRDCQICFFGHTHHPGIFSEDGVYAVGEDSKFLFGDRKVFFVNPGSVGQPRDGDPRASFGIMDTETMEYEQIRLVSLVTA